MHYVCLGGQHIYYYCVAFVCVPEIGAPQGRDFLIHKT